MLSLNKYLVGLLLVLLLQACGRKDRDVVDQSLEIAQSLISPTELQKRSTIELPGFVFPRGGNDGGAGGDGAGACLRILLLEPSSQTLGSRLCR